MITNYDLVCLIMTCGKKDDIYPGQTEKALKILEDRDLKRDKMLKKLSKVSE
jgi:hypothetical protein